MFPSNIDFPEQTVGLPGQVAPCLAQRWDQYDFICLMCSQIMIPKEIPKGWELCLTGTFWYYPLLCKNCFALEIPLKKRVEIVHMEKSSKCFYGESRASMDVDSWENHPETAGVCTGKTAFGHPGTDDFPLPHSSHPKEVCSGWLQKVKRDSLEQQWTGAGKSQCSMILCPYKQRWTCHCMILTQMF